MASIGLLVARADVAEFQLEAFFRVAA